MTKDIGLPLSVVKEDIKGEVPEKNKKIEELLVIKDEVDKVPSSRTSLMGLNDSDEFFDVPEPTSDYDHFENEWHSDMDSEQMVFILPPSICWSFMDSEFPFYLPLLNLSSDSDAFCYPE